MSRFLSASWSHRFAKRQRLAAVCVCVPTLVLRSSYRKLGVLPLAHLSVLRGDGVWGWGMVIHYGIYTYKRVVCVCWFVGLLVCFLSATRHLSTLRRCLRVAESRISRRGRPRASGQAHAQREHTRACRTTSQRKNRCVDAFQKQNRTRALVGADLGQLVLYKYGVQSNT